jgi:putative ABC transport system permease protein
LAIEPQRGRIVRWVREFAARIHGFLRFGGRDRGSAGLDRLNDELRFHLDMLEGELRRQNMDPEAARREARRRLGGATQIEEAYVEQRTLPALESIVQDLRYGVRMLRRSPGFTLAALLTLGLGIGANTAIFSIVNAVLLRPLPFAAPDRLMAVGDRTPAGGASNTDFTTLGDYRARNQTFENMVLMRSWFPTLVADGEAERLPAARVSWEFFAMLGVTPALGRAFRPDEDRPDHWRVVLLSDALWRRRFNADPAVVGRTIRMNDVAYEVVGVMPSGLEELISSRFYAPAEIWAPVGYDTTLRDACRGCQHLRGFGRLKPGVTPAQASADLNAIRAQLVREHPQAYRQGEVAVIPLDVEISRSVQSPLYVLLGAVGFVMLIACANVANLLLSRAANRSREIAVRAALGAGRGRLIRQLLTESSLLGLAGGVLGVTFAALTIRGVAAVAPLSIPRLDHVSIDGTVLAFAAAMSLLTGVGFGLIPALRGSSFRLREALASDARTSTGAGSRVARHLLVIGDLALALVLLAGAALMIKTVRSLMLADPGFNAQGVLTAQFSLVGQAYREDPAVVAFQNRVLEKVQALPGVQAVALAGQVPMGKNYDTWGFHIEGMTQPNTSDDPSVQRYSVTPDYFRVMQIPLVRGRGIEAADATNGQLVIVISESTAKLWGGLDPIGRGVRIGGANSPLRTVVGIVGDVRHASLDERESTAMYLPQTQVTDSFLVLTARVATTQPEQLTHGIRQVLKDLDPSVPVYSVARLDDLLEQSYADRKFVMRLLGAFALLALLLAAIGLYGVVAYTVSRRTREVGLRVALGARPADILRLVVLNGLGIVAAGLAVGLAAAFTLTRFLGSLLFGVGATDPAAIAGSAGVLMAVAILAHWVPARRAMSVDPAIALRQE